MDDESLAKKYISILNEILSRELLSLSLDDDEEEELDKLKNSSEIWNNNFGLDKINFLFFLEKLEKKKILKIFYYNTLKPSEEEDGLLDSYYGKDMHKGDWLAIHYGEVNTELITKYRNELKELLEFNEEIKNKDSLNLNIQEKSKIELIYSKKKGICLKSDRNLLYSPRKNTDRFYYLESLIKNIGKKFTRKQLDGKTKKRNKNNLNQNYITSGSITEMNKIIKRDLKLKKDFILGKNGYRINEENYEIEIED